MREAMPIRVWLLFFWGCGLRECLFAQSDVSGRCILQRAHLFRFCIHLLD